jgi:cellulose biosynthesis protein BcsQ
MTVTVGAEQKGGMGKTTTAASVGGVLESAVPFCLRD